jgi:hypothetical protein
MIEPAASATVMVHWVHLPSVEAVAMGRIGGPGGESVREAQQQPGESANAARGEPLGGR